MKTCLQIWQEYQQASDKLCEDFRIAMIEARAQEFPIGTKVTFSHGLKRIKGTVFKHPEYERQTDKVIVKNGKSGAEWEKAVQELRHV
jgi:hypothetical protein